jgi:hypothetical protein
LDGDRETQKFLMDNLQDCGDKIYSFSSYVGLYNVEPYKYYRGFNGDFYMIREAYRGKTKKVWHGCRVWFETQIKVDEQNGKNVCSIVELKILKVRTEHGWL